MSGKPTFGFDITMHHTGVMEIGEAFQHLQRVDHDDSFVLDAAMFKQSGKRAARAVFHENVHLVPMWFYTIIRHNVGMIKNL